VAAVITLVTLVTSPGVLEDPLDEGIRILRNVGGELLVMEMKALGSFETAGPGLLGMKTKALGLFETSGQALHDLKTKALGLFETSVEDCLA